MTSSRNTCPWRPPVGFALDLSDAELVTLAVMQGLLGYVSEHRWHRYARGNLRHLFPYLPKQSGYNKRLRAATGLLHSIARLLAERCSVWADDVWVVDSTPVECGRSGETAKRSDLAGWAEYGYCASRSRYFWGLRLHLVCTLQGLPVAWALTGAKADERETLIDLLAAAPDLRAARTGQTIIAELLPQGFRVAAAPTGLPPAAPRTSRRATPTGRGPVQAPAAGAGAHPKEYAPASCNASSP